MNTGSREFALDKLAVMKSTYENLLTRISDVTGGKGVIYTVTL